MARPTGTRSPRAATPLDTCGLAALGLLAMLLPFELRQPVLSLGPVGVTNVELALYLVLLVWALIWLRGPRSAWTGVHGAVAAWLAIVLLAAVLAPTGRGEAVKFALRTLGGGALFFATQDLVSTRRQVAWIALALCAGAVLSAAAGVAEIWLPAVRGGLAAFKTQASFAGGFLRASGTLQYANTAGMYWEAVLPLVLAIGVWAVTRGGSDGTPAPPAWRWSATTAAVVLVQAVVLTASRAAWFAVAGLLAMLFVAGVRLSRPLRGPVVVVSLALLLFTVGGWGGRGLLLLRLLANDEATWLSAGFADPPTTLAIPTGTVTTVPMTVRNTGRRDWPRRGNTAVYLSYHLVAPDGEATLLWNGARTPLPNTVAAGDAVTVPAVIDGNVPPGRYRLQWDMVQEQIAWFSALGAPTATTWVEVMHRDDDRWWPSCHHRSSSPPTGCGRPVARSGRPRSACGLSTRWSASVRTSSGTSPARVSISRRSTTGRTREQSVCRNPRRTRDPRSPRPPGAARDRRANGRARLASARGTGPAGPRARSGAGRAGLCGARRRRPFSGVHADLWPVLGADRSDGAGLQPGGADVRPTTVGFDVTPLEERERTGVGRYVERLLAALVARGDTFRYHVLASRPLQRALPTGVVGPGGQRFPTRWLWMQAMLPVTLSRLQPRMCHFTNGMAPVNCPCPYVLTLYDMSLFLHAHTQPWKSRLLIRGLVPRVARRAAAVITATNSARDDIIRVLGLPPARVQVVSGGVDTAFRLTDTPGTLDPVRRRYGLDRPFILSVGTLEPRKNLGRLTRAFGQLRAQGRQEDLVLVGRNGWGRDEARRVADELGIATSVRTLGYIPESDLPALYALARVVAFPSLYEGFGFPIVEAMACGTPVLTSDRSAMAEIGRDAAVLIDPTQVGAIADGLAALLDERPLRERLRAAGLRRAASLRWPTVADRTVAVYDRVLASAGPARTRTSERPVSRPLEAKKET